MLLRSAEVKPFVLKICSTFLLNFSFFFVGHLLEGWSFELCEFMFLCGDWKDDLFILFPILCDSDE